jgi:TM2 domain-containing membrane protein YozV
MSDSPTARSPTIQDDTQRSHRDAQAMLRYDANKKSVGVAYGLWFFFCFLGAHRFYLKQTGTAIAMLVIFLVSLPLTLAAVGFLGLAVVGIWCFVDAFLIPGMTRDYNNRLITQLNM